MRGYLCTVSRNVGGTCHVTSGSGNAGCLGLRVLGGSPKMVPMRGTETVRAEAERRGLSRMAVQRERERARTVDPRLVRQAEYLHRALGMRPATVASKLGVDLATVVRVLAQ